MLVTSMGLRARGVVSVLLLAVCAAGAWDSEETKERGRWKWSYYRSDVIQLECYTLENGSEDRSHAYELEAVHIPPFNRTEMQLRQSDTNLTMLGSKLDLSRCPFPRGSLADALASLQYPVAELQELELRQQRSDFPPRAEHFTGLHLRKLEIRCSYTKPHINSDIFSSLANLTELELWEGILSPMPATSRLRTVTLRGGRSTGAWGGCAELRELSLDQWEVPAKGEGEDEGWLEQCPQLSTVLAHLIPASSLVRVLRGTRALTSLQIDEHYENDMPPMQLASMLSGLPLQQLALPYKMFTLISENTLPTSLEKLTLYGAGWSSDEEENQRVARRLAQLPALRELALEPLFFEHSSNADFCKVFPENGTNIGSLPALRRLTLAGTATKKLCFSWLESLEYLDLSRTRIGKLELVQLPPAHAHPLLVDLRYTAVHDILLDEAGYNLLKDKYIEGTNVTVLGEMDLSCDCEHAWVARALRTLPLSVPRAVCNNILKNSYYYLVVLSDVSAEQFECGRVTNERHEH